MVSTPPDQKPVTERSASAPLAGRPPMYEQQTAGSLALAGAVVLSRPMRRVDPTRFSSAGNCLGICALSRLSQLAPKSAWAAESLALAMSTSGIGSPQSDQTVRGKASVRECMFADPTDPTRIPRRLQPCETKGSS